MALGRREARVREGAQRCVLLDAAMLHAAARRTRVALAAVDVDLALLVRPADPLLGEAGREETSQENKREGRAEKRFMHRAIFIANRMPAPPRVHSTSIDYSSTFLA